MGSLWGGDGALIWGHYGGQMGLAYRVTMGEIGEGGRSAPWCGGGEKVLGGMWGEMGLTYGVTMGMEGE